jgi:hypothetical protein
VRLPSTNAKLIVCSRERARRAVLVMRLAPVILTGRMAHQNAAGGRAQAAPEGDGDFKWGRKRSGARSLWG